MIIGKGLTFFMIAWDETQLEIDHYTIKNNDVKNFLIFNAKNKASIFKNIRIKYYISRLLFHKIVKANISHITNIQICVHILNGTDLKEICWFFLTH